MQRHPLSLALLPLALLLAGPVRASGGDFASSGSGLDSRNGPSESFPGSSLPNQDPSFVAPAGDGKRSSYKVLYLPVIPVKTGKGSGGTETSSFSSAAPPAASFRKGENLEYDGAASSHAASGYSSTSGEPAAFAGK